MGPCRVFFPQQALDYWLSEDKVELSGSSLTFKAERRRFRVVEAVRVLRKDTQLEDAFELVGKVKTVNFLLELGAELLQNSMILGENAYEIVPGFVGIPWGGPDQAGADAAHPSARKAEPLPGASQTDEELLATLALRDFGPGVD
jgi:hypothetical protein